MQRDAWTDFKAHPEWFDVVALRPNLPNQMMKALDPKGYQLAMDAYINPPLVIVRKPIPFVLPIKGSAL